MPIETDDSALISQLDPTTRKAAGWPEYPVYYRPGDLGSHNVTEPAPTKIAKIPHCIFFYYIRIDREGKLRVTHYYFDNDLDPIDDLGHFIGLLAKYARNGRWDPANGREPELQKYANFTGIRIKRISYFVVFIDELHWDFLADGNGNPVVPFHVFKGRSKKDPNYSFYDGRLHQIEMPKNGATDFRPALSMLNLLRRADGEELGWGFTGKEEEQFFAFDLILRVTFANADEYDSQGDPIGTPSKLTVNFDPGGTNLGPPIDPP